MEECVRRSARPAIAVTVLIVFLGLATPSLADPGSPGLTEATAGVYVVSEEGFGTTQLAEPDQAEPLSATGTPTAVGDATGLPFTGLAAPAMLVAGLIALAIGISLRQLARTDRA